MKLKTQEEIEERWLPIKEYSGVYEVSDMGRVRSIDRSITTSNSETKFVHGKIIRVSKNPHGYSVVKLSRNGTVKHYQVHRLVLLSFLGRENSKTVANHKNSNRNDNRLTNLEWVTQAQNMRHMVESGRSLKGEKNKSAKLTPCEVEKIKSYYKKGTETHRSIAKKFNVSHNCIGLILRGETWKTA